MRRVAAFVVIASGVIHASANRFPESVQAPSTEVYLAPLDLKANTIGAWVNISNNAGYDNQPSFLPDGSAVLFSSARDAGQSDIWRYTIATKALLPLTRTAWADYSPLVTAEGKGFSAVSLEEDKRQRLWHFDLDGANQRVLLELPSPIGYHTWIDRNRLALLVLGSPNTLQLADLTTGKAEVIASGIGRSLLIHPRHGRVTFMSTGQARMIRELDPDTRAIRELMAPLEGSQDAAWAPDGRLLMARGTIISAATPAPGAAWTVFADLSKSATPGPAIASVTRMAVSRDGRWLAFVAEPQTK